ncbi:sporulation related protein [Azospirillum brasilense]|uniref:Sporulation related protein n=1 Tax=Azospirillum brasilense TaxID=192 RepID=A0A560BLN5_AZOBR|nr:sporulation related protein [Azospirillum brasilense]
MCNLAVPVTHRSSDRSSQQVDGTVRFRKSLLTAALLSGLLAACASDPSSSSRDTNIDAHIAEASRRFGMPEQWIREVIRQESGGRTMMNGRPITSHAGAMGLMQVMPVTYSEMRRKHGLGSDPYHPRDNILAGTAYLREMYDLFGSPGFLGAYNCGPGCYADYLAGNRRLPGETRRYIASVSPRLEGGITGGAVEVASLPVTQPPPISAAPAPVVPVTPVPAPPVAPLPPPVIAATPLPVKVAAAGGWTVQLGAFRSPDDSARIIDRARRSMPGTLSRTERVVQTVDTQNGPLYRARLTGLTQQDAAQSCASLTGMGMACFVVPPGA